MALLAVLVPLLVSIRGDLHALTERVARIEGALTGPWRPPTNGTPAAAPSPQSKTES